MSEKPAAIIILAAGQGTRMKSSRPKVLHQIGGRTLLAHVITAAQGLQPDHIAVVVRHDRDAVAAHAEHTHPGVIIADQDDVPGTGRATWSAMQALPQDLAGPVIILAADVPLIDTATLTDLLTHHTGGVTILSTVVDNPHGYGRIVRDHTGAVAGIVEEKDATDAQRDITEINSGVYAVDAQFLRSALDQLGTDNVQGEMYLTDVVAIAREQGQVVSAQISDDPIVAEGVNDKVQLAVMGGELNKRILTAWMKAGVTIVDPATTWVDVTVRLEPDSTILPNSQLLGNTRVGQGATIGPNTTLENVEVGHDASVLRAHAIDSVIGAHATVGPFSYLRQNTVLADGAKVGPFAESKNSRLGPGAKLPHLSYLGDADVGQGANIGAGTITANYDGINKYRTTIGDHARIGSGNMLVPPITIGDGAYTGAGTTLREDVPPGALAVPEAGGQAVGQNNIENWTMTRRPGTTSADAAQAALEGEDTNLDDSAEPANPQQEKKPR